MVSNKKAEYPECERLSLFHKHIVAITQFMEWLQERGLFLCRHETEEDVKAKGDEPLADGSYFVFPYPIPIGKRVEELLYEYFDINAQKLEQERRAMLDKLRKEQGMT